MKKSSQGSSGSSRGKVVKLRKEAMAFLKKNPGGFALRSCWNCNSAHEHLKDPDMDVPIKCFECGHWYMRGIDITDNRPEIKKET